MNESSQNRDRAIPPFHQTNAETPEMGGGLPVIKYWAKHTLSAEGPTLWKTLLHKSACLSCSWGTGGQKGGFTDETGAVLQRCMKSVEAISSELQPPVPQHFFERYCLNDLQQLSSMDCDRLGRLSYPVILRAGQSHYERISWDEALDIATRAFQKVPERVASYSSGRSSNEAAYLLQLMIRALGSNNLADCSDLCHAPSTEGLKNTLGTRTSVVSLESLKQTDCVVLVGSNCSYNHPRLMNELIKLRDQGKPIIVINPVMEVGLVKFASPAFPATSLLQGSEVSSFYLQPIPGSDVALFVGFQKALLEHNLIQYDYLKAYTENWESILHHAQSTSWEQIVETCGIAQAEIEAAALVIGTSPKVVFAWAMGITQHVNGVDNVYSICNTALLTGNLGKEGAGVMPIRGHSNVQGFGSMGVTTDLKQEIKEALEIVLEKPLSRVKGYDTRSLIEAADQGKVDSLLCLGGNLYAANPDSKQAKRALGQIETIIYLATKPNLGHFHGLAHQQTIILPVLNRFENPHKTTVESGNNFVRLNDEGKTHLKKADLMPEITFLAELAHRLHGDRPVDWRQLHDPKYIRQLISKTIPGYQQIGDIDQTKAEFTIEGRILTTPKFSTPSGKAKLISTPLPDVSLPTSDSFEIPANQPAIVLALMTGRSYSQHNTVVYKPGDQYRGIPHRNCILMHHHDADRLGVQAHDQVTVRGDAGQMTNVEVILGALRPGSALMFYPEVNQIFKARVDKRCGTPAYKRVPICVFCPKEASSKAVPV